MEQKTKTKEWTIRILSTDTIPDDEEFATEAEIEEDVNRLLSRTTSYYPALLKYEVIEAYEYKEEEE